MQPFLVGFILDYLQGSGDITKADAYTFAVTVVAVSLYISVPNSVDYHVVWVLGIRGRTALSALIYKKVK